MSNIVNLSNEAKSVLLRRKSELAIEGKSYSYSKIIIEALN